MSVENDWRRSVVLPRHGVEVSRRLLVVMSAGALCGLVMPELAVAQTSGEKSPGYVIPRNMKVLLGVIPDLKDVGSPSRSDGLLVAGVYPEGVADKSGIRAGDRILEFNNQVVNSPQGLVDILVSLNWGDSVPAVILRQGERKQIMVLFPR